MSIGLYEYSSAPYAVSIIDHREIVVIVGGAAAPLCAVVVIADGKLHLVAVSAVIADYLRTHVFDIAAASAGDTIYPAVLFREAGIYYYVIVVFVAEYLPIVGDDIVYGGYPLVLDKEVFLLASVNRVGFLY